MRTVLLVITLNRSQITRKNVPRHAIAHSNFSIIFTLDTTRSIAMNDNNNNNRKNNNFRTLDTEQ